MELFLMVLVVSMVGLALTCVTFSLAMQSDETADGAAEAKPVAEPAAPRFFADSPVPMTALAPRLPAIPNEALLLQIERHIRLEHAAVEAFIEQPTLQSLHSRTTSRLLN